jgi:hypothetical protein
VIDNARALCDALKAAAGASSPAAPTTTFDRVLRADEDTEDEAKVAAFSAEMEAVKAEVHALTSRFPLY